MLQLFAITNAEKSGIQCYFKELENCPIKVLFCYLYGVKKKNPKDHNIYEKRLYALFRLIRIAKMLQSAKIKINPQST